MSTRSKMRGKIKKVIIPLLFMGLLFFGILVVAGLGLHWYLNDSKPRQPIAFSHNIHIEKAGLDCAHCHYYADKSPRAGIPAVQVCMNCHENVAVDKPEIKKLKRYWDKKQPIPWVKVHTQPWHVRFTHKRHIRANIQCTYCHGEVKAMDTVRKTRSLEMGWCLTCHRENSAPTDCLNCHQ